MALIELKNIGKIYVSGNNVAVGIRGVNLSFDKGEFVAVTGESGSGKSTLLNVLSGMDTYEEGELLIEGEPTSHYVQPDWESYRQKYISFIFQNYNIIESFTVLQNVELALMHIRSPKQRRQRAVEILRRVGMENHLRHKGSKLSGGQKQRTVIARALAKDSPIILADEPTGNLDSETSKEIVELLREVSHDKLVIIVTHTFDQVAECATRHIRVFDSAVEADERLAAPTAVATEAETAPAAQADAAAAAEKSPDKRLKAKKNNRAARAGGRLLDGLTLGRIRFSAMPKLSTFLCILMVICALAMTFITSLSVNAFTGLSEKSYLFAHVDGRVVVIRNDGSVITEQQLAAAVEQTGAASSLHYDFLLDMPQEIVLGDSYYILSVTYGSFGHVDAGRVPEAANEVMLRVPVSLQNYFGTSDFKQTVLTNLFGIAEYTIVGVDYYYDNTVSPEMVLTSEGYEIASALAFFAKSAANFTLDTSITDNQKIPDTLTSSISGSNMHVSFEIGENCYYINSEAYTENLKHFEDIRLAGKIKKYAYTVSSTLSGAFINYSYGSSGYIDDIYPANGNGTSSSVVVDPSYGGQNKVSASMDAYQSLETIDSALRGQMQYNGWQLLLSPEIIVDFMTQNYYTSAYTQASLFYSNDAQANAAIAQLRELGFTAAASDSLVKSGSDAILATVSQLLSVGVWIITILFITLFLSLCSTHAMLATRDDIAILRSMGISTAVIKCSVYVQTLLSLIPAYIVTAAAAFFIFIYPTTNGMFGYLHRTEYITIAVALLAIGLLLSRRYVKKMFSSSVKKTLNGGEEQ